MLHTFFLITTLEYGPAWLPLFAVFIRCDARIYARFLLFALFGGTVYTVYIQTDPKEKVTHPAHYPQVQAESILHHILQYLLIVSICSIIAISSQ
jgi:hypothetical protein